MRLALHQTLREIESLARLTVECKNDSCVELPAFVLRKTVKRGARQLHTGRGFAGEMMCPGKACMQPRRPWIDVNRCEQLLDRFAKAVPAQCHHRAGARDPRIVLQMRRAFQ